MDQLMVDCGDARPSPGDEVVLLGSQGDDVIAAHELAERAGTIAYEIVTRIGGPGAQEVPGMRKRVAAIGAGVAAGAIAAGAVSRTVMRRRTGQHLEAELWDLPPDDLGPVESFDGTRIAVRAAGDPDAPVLLFVHGFSLDMTIWHEQWVDLSAGFRCVLMDQRGHGSSGPPAHGDLSLRAMGRDVAAVLDAVAPARRAVVVGHSLGAMAAIAMAEQRPELFGPRVAGVVLVGASSDDLLRGAMGSLTDLLRRRPAHARPARRVGSIGPQGGHGEPGRPPRRRRAAHPVRAGRAGRTSSITSCGSPSVPPPRCGPTDSPN